MKKLILIFFLLKIFMEKFLNQILPHILLKPIKKSKIGI